MPPSPLPLVYCCSGCSRLAHLADDLARRLDREGLAERACIAGIHGEVPALLRKARDARTILAVNGCEKGCVQTCLARHGVPVARCVTLTDYGITTRDPLDSFASDFEMLYEELRFLLRTTA